MWAITPQESGQILVKPHEDNNYSQLCLFALVLAILPTPSSLYNNSLMHFQWQRKEIMEHQYNKAVE